MSTDDEHLQRLGSKDSPQLPRSLATFIGQMLGNHYQDTVMAPLSDELQRLVDALDVAERDEDAGTERKRPSRVLSWASAKAFQRERATRISTCRYATRPMQEL